VLLKTTNGGQNFVNLFANIPPSGNGHIALLGIWFVNQQTGWLGAANLEHNNIYKTTNGGTNWFFQNNPVSQQGWNQINDVKFISPDSGWAVHGTPSTGAIMFTSNAGANWVMDNTTIDWYDCISFYQRSKAWCGGSSGRMWYAYLQLVGIEPGRNGTPLQFRLHQNFPNPFNAETVIGYDLNANGFVNLKVFDVLGKIVKEPVREYQRAGNYQIRFDASGLPSGIYYYQLSTPASEVTKKMVLVK